MNNSILNTQKSLEKSSNRSMKRSSIGKEEDEKSRVKVRAPGLGGEVGSEGDVVRL